ncbi:MAG TPA: sulfatase-like hydrolase/transferase [Candidatus Saccharimonadales bacterium]|nr:sulfatase-like hydrolase/transferase [Candidatus Saccharimonadales bacterium]
MRHSMRTKERPNVIFLMLDTLTADHLKMYGGGIRMKNLERMAGLGVTYKNAIAPGTYTLPSHTSLFTGRRVRGIKIFGKDPIKNYKENTDPLLMKNRFVGERDMTLAMRMSYLGYKTALLSNNPFVTPATGLGQGFSFIKSIFVEKKVETHKASLSLIGNDAARESLIRLAYYLSRFIPEKRLDRLYLELRNTLNKKFGKEADFYSLDQGAELTNRIADDYLSKTGERDHFMFINYMEAHEGYPTNMVTERYVSQDRWMYLSRLIEHDDVQVLKKAYAKRLEYLDRKIGEALEMFKKRGILENALVIATSDHGQAFGEHGQLYHSLFPYNEISKVPLVVAKYLGGKQVAEKEVVERSVSISALNESIVNVGYRKTDIIDGALRRDSFVFSDHVGLSDVWDITLLRLLKGRSKHAEQIYKAKLKYNNFATAIYFGKHKLVHYYNKMPDELYDLEQDPKEAENILGKNRELARRMLKANSAA